MDGLTPEVVHVLELYQKTKRTAPKKFDAFLTRTSSKDNCLSGGHIYGGGHTGRFASVGVNTQNLARPKLYLKGDKDYANTPIAFFDEDEWRKLELIFGRDFIDVLCGTIRGMIKAPKGHRFFIADYSAIEARVIAFIAGEELLLETFHSGGDVYVVQAATMFNCREDQVDDTMRLIGKVAILALGFGGSVGAFQSMATIYGLDNITEAKTKVYVRGYRQANPKIVDLWSRVNDALLNAVHRKGQTFVVNEYLSFYCTAKAPFCLEMRLPSGRALHYWYPKIVKGSKYGNPTLSYLGVDSETKRWTRQEAWYGLIVENAVQAIANDLLRYALVELTAYPQYDTFMHVHDEIGAVVADDTGSMDEYVDIITRVPDWFEGFPLDAEGYIAQRYRK